MNTFWIFQYELLIPQTEPSEYIKTDLAMSNL